MNLWALPIRVVADGLTLSRLKTEIDWFGATLASATLALVSYVLS